MTKNKSRVPENENSQDRFRRVIAQRLKPVVKYIGMIEKMPVQPNYEISAHDAQLVIDEINRVTNTCIAIFEAAKSGDLKAKEIKTYQGVDWDKELDDASNETQED